MLGPLEKVMTGDSELLKVEGLTKAFGGVVAVNSVDLAVKSNEIVGLIGPNGAGKTTLFNMVTGFVKPSAGSIRFQGIDITTMPPYRRGLLGIVCTFQKTAVFPDTTVWQSIRMGQHRVTSSGPLDALFGRRRHHEDERITQKRAIELTEFLGLSGYAGQQAKSLSYGQQRLVELAIALAAQPALLLLDEPAAGLNPTESANLGSIIRVVRDQGTTVFLVEHDMSVTMSVCDRIYVIASGNKIAEGTPREIQTNEAVIEAYLGSSNVAG
jgi:branched-chain amino acid transport system ATP-binding protein